MEFATGALGVLLPKLSQLLKDEYDLHVGAKKDINYLSKELECMHAALRNVGELPPEQLDELVKIWARDVRELSYDMEDIIDTFMVRIHGPEPPRRRSTKRFMKKMMQKVTKASAWHQVGRDIKGIKERVKEVAERRDRYKLDTVAPAFTLIDPRITALYTKFTDLVDIDEAMEELITRLTEEDNIPTQKHKTISIVGFGGLGKTTLAKAVYDKLKMQFDCTAFISVSRNPDTKKLLKDMLYEFDKEKFWNIHSAMLDERHLIDLVQESVKNKSYFIVIDDIWSTEPWNILKCALVENYTRSRIITTTRIIGVAEKVGNYCYKLKPLTPHSSKILFCRKVFGCEDKLPMQYVEVSERILNKCGGVPLAILTISGLLANKLGNIKEWYKLCDYIGSGIGGNRDMENMRKILSLSYSDLPSYLKTCLLYLSVFPEDYEIGRRQLIWRWIAEDFVQHGEGGESVFDIGESYFSELVNRSLIQPTGIYDFDWAHKPSSCIVHDMVHDLICSLSREENFVTIGLGDTNQNTHSCGSKIHRLSLADVTWPPTDMSKLNTSKLRSLAIFGPALINSMPSHPCYDLLRVLDLEDCIICQGHPSLRFIASLFHLRYLGLPDRAYTDELLVEVGKLQFLQSLDITGADHISELPSSILGLRKLMLLSARMDIRLPAGLRNLTSLEELSAGFVDSAQIAEELGHLTRLRVLDVRLEKGKEGRWDERLRTALVGSIGKLHEIQRLEIQNNHLAGDLGGSMQSLGNLRQLTIYGISFLPTTWINSASLPLLSRLHIMVSQVRREDIQVLGMLQALTFLNLDVLGPQQERQVLQRFMVAADAFPCLTSCIFEGFSSVPSMFPPGAMPRLQQVSLWLFIGGEFFFTVDDLALGHLPSLKEVHVTLHDEKQRDSDDIVTEAKKRLKREADVHPNHPSIVFSSSW